MEIKIAGRNISNFRYADDTTLMAESEEELKNLLMKLKEESEKAGLKFNIQNTKIMASGPITSWQIDGETMETVRDYFGGAPKSLQMMTATMKLKDACSLEEKLRESILRLTDKKSGVPEEEKGVWGSQGGGGKDKLYFSGLQNHCRW